MSQKKSAVRLISVFLRLILAIFALILVLILAFPIGFYGMALYLEPSLPDVKELKTMQLHMPLQIYTADNKLIGQYGNKYSLPVAYDEVPKPLVQAFLAAEDDTFFEHTGISVKGLGRAITEVATNDDSQTGGSTITMQVAKNYFLSSERTVQRKLTELFIARKIENTLNKQEIFTLYVNKIYLGEGSYGIRAAAKRYFSKSLENLTLAEMAMIAGLPKAPSAYNPVNNPTRALQRRNWILGRMLAHGFINKQQHDEAVQAPIGLHLYREKLDLNMPYLAEMARSSLVENYGEQVMDSGWRVKLTVNSQDQIHAEQVLISGLRNYESYSDSGYRGVEALDGDLANFKPFDNMYPAKITKVLGGGVYQAVLASGENIRVINIKGWASGKHFGSNRVDGKAKDTPRSIKVNNIVRVVQQNNQWVITQPTRVQGALVALNPNDGALITVVGGFNFYHSKFNRATQGYRQPGSIIKPLVYSAALEANKITPDSVISNAPINLGGWRPKNAGGGAGGAVSVRSALARSLNLPSVRIMQMAGIERTHVMLSRLGLEKERLPSNYTLALGATEATPLQMTLAYTAFINGGYRVQPYFIDKIYNYHNTIVYQSNPVRANAKSFNDNLDKINAKLLKDFEKHHQNITNEYGELDAAPQFDRLNPAQAPQYQLAEQAPRILSAKTASNMTSMLRGVVAGGTAKKALALGRADIGGKTGTTNRAKDVWFAGVHPTTAAVVWMGYDTPEPLKGKAFGGTLALPIWVSYMREQLNNRPKEEWDTVATSESPSKTNAKKSTPAPKNKEVQEQRAETPKMAAEPTIPKANILPTDEQDSVDNDDFIPEGDGEDTP